MESVTSHPLSHTHTHTPLDPDTPVLLRLKSTSMVLRVADRFHLDILLLKVENQQTLLLFFFSKSF